MTKVACSKFGETNDGCVVNLFVLSSNNIEVGVINYGATIVFLKVPDKTGKIDDIVTGFDTLSEYMEKRTFFGSTVGRVANRIGNGKFCIDGKEYTLPINNGPNCLHGGISGFDKRIWEGDIEGESVVFRLTSPDGDEGFPGELTAVVSYTLVENALITKYQATSTKATPINLSNHAFFNLAGHDNWDEDLSNHQIIIPADAYLPADDDCFVTGEIKPVDGTVFDLRSPSILTEELLARAPGLGIDHNFCLQRNKERHLAAIVKHLPSGRTMTVESTQPGVQLYTGNFLAGISGKKGVRYSKHTALCLESQNWPDAINHKETFPESILYPGDEYNHTTWWMFDA